MRACLILFAFLLAAPLPGVASDDLLLAQAEVTSRPLEDAGEPAGASAVGVVRVRSRVPVAERPAAAEEQAPAREPAAEPVRPAEGTFSPPSGGARIQVFVIPVSSAVASAAGPAQIAFEKEIARLPALKAVDLVEALRVPPTPEEAAALAAARRSVEEALRHQVSHRYEEAVQALRSSLEQLEKAGPAMEAAEYAGVQAQLGHALILAGEEPWGRETLRTAARIDLARAVHEQEVGARAARALDLARDQVAAGPKGALSVVTSPAGARVFVGGVYKGTTPVTADNVPAGIAHVRIDRPGIVPVVQLVDVRPAQDTSVRVRLRPTEEAVSLQKTLVQVPQALDRTPGVPDMATALGRRFRLDRMAVVTVGAASPGKVALRAAVFDFGRDARLADEKTTLASDVKGGLQAAVGSWAAQVFDKADGSRNRAAADPLDRTSGTESWYSTTHQRSRDLSGAGSEAKAPAREEKKATTRDPLNRFDGTEDW